MRDTFPALSVRWSSPSMCHFAEEEEHYGIQIPLILSDIYCTLTVLCCTFYWLPLYPTIPYFTFLLNSTVIHCISLYKTTDFPLYATLHCTDKHYTHCPPMSLALTTTVIDCTINLKNKIFLNICNMIFSSRFSCLQQLHRKEFNRS